MPLTPALRRLLILYAGLIAANAAVWLWALAVLRDHPLLLGTAAIAYGLGLRHAVDADHIAAIDVATRKLMQEGQRPVSVGLFFSLGHSTIVIAATLGIALTAFALRDRFDAFREIGGTIGIAVFSTIAAGATGAVGGAHAAAGISHAFVAAGMLTALASLAAFLVLLTSAAVLVLEILVSRLVAPYVGLTLETYTAAIGVALAAIAAGSALGGRLADTSDPRRWLGIATAVGGALVLAARPTVFAVGGEFRGLGPVGTVVLVGLAVDDVVPPHVAALRPAHLGAGALDDEHLLDGVGVLQGLVDG